MTIATIRLNVSNLERARSYYCDALGFAVANHEAQSTRNARLVLGAQQIELVEADGRPYPPGSTAADLWFQHFAVVTTDIVAAHALAMRHETTAISQGGPQLLPPGAGNVRAFKFRDPDGHPLELIQFAGATHAWPARSDRLTLGIDHTAISVSDAECSIAFYESLGLRLRSRQTNSGPAQENLDRLQGVVVDVIAMERSGTPPHLELLCYRTPRGRMLADRDRRDIATTVTVLAAPTATRKDGLRDPDGHAICLATEPTRTVIS